MSPQRKGLLRPADEERIRKAIEIRALAELEVVAAVLTAMKHGGSIAETAAASGLSERTIIRWRKGQGLPTLDDWHKDSRERREQLYGAYPWLRDTEAGIRRLRDESVAPDTVSGVRSDERGPATMPGDEAKPTGLEST